MNAIDTPITTDETSPTNTRVAQKLAIIAGLAALADWLLYGHTVGISAALFIVALTAGMLLVNPVQADRRAMLAAAGVLLAALVAIVEANDILQLAIGVIAAAHFAVVAMTQTRSRLSMRLVAVVWFLAAGPIQWLVDCTEGRITMPRTGTMTRAAGELAVWIVPVLLGVVFMALFAFANPVIERWFAELNFSHSLSQIDLKRVVFWLGIATVAWPFVWVASRQAEVDRFLSSSLELPPIPTAPNVVFGEAAILRSLILFNLLFAVQTVMDINYLWRGAELPQGMSYASYAHRGAYPLIVTALLAAAFVIAAMRPGSAAERSPLIRALVFLWTGQNILLVVSSILRLDLYVQVYSVTYLRVGAFVWMLLVAVGLVLIVARIVFGRSNGWLIEMNLAALALTVYMCSLVNIPSLVAMYNVSHSREVGGPGEPLDVDYLMGLGPQAIPAMDLYLTRRPEAAARGLGIFRNTLAVRHLNEMQDWRAWSLRGWRLKAYLEGRAVAPR